ncbi:hypothetical protein CYMTET_15124 [Cymbomonas tetramitiformis]|uniref:Uncharacterized protein n=1 Tax=Cymbomonas tetramitiformis TaxID=36881 RepID=A0AAE0GF05_9CHLO|nr:hypothetical protein CYMTET_15124 [Cymbomonas tetramitiformis]
MLHPKSLTRAVVFSVLFLNIVSSTSLDIANEDISVRSNVGGRKLASTPEERAAKRARALAKELQAPPGASPIVAQVDQILMAKQGSLNTGIVAGAPPGTSEAVVNMTVGTTENGTQAIPQNDGTTAGSLVKPKRKKSLMRWLKNGRRLFWD